MIEIKEFKLIWKEVWNCQIITGWDKIKIIILIKALNNLNIYKSYLDISAYSKTKNIEFDFVNKWDSIYSFETTIDVYFLDEHWIDVWLNNDKSRIQLLINTEKWDFSYFSNPIWNADYGSFYIKDHHLWVYTKWNSLNLDKLRELSRIDIYDNDIIFINRHFWNDLFINFDW